MDFKYSAELAQYPNCPPKNAQQLCRPAFRFVHADLEDKRNFLPVAKLNPARVIPEHLLCESLALSMFASKESAERRYQSLRRQVKNIYKTIGTHLATCNLSEEDGISTIASETGHFSLFESKDINWEKRFTIVGDLRGNG
jgi:hypothetical protein